MFLIIFLANEEKGLKLLNKHGEKNFVINRFSNKFDEKIISRPTKSREKLKEPILANLEKRLDIYITHEWNIRLLNSYLHDMIEGDLELPGFLEGFFD